MTIFPYQALTRWYFLLTGFLLIAVLYFTIDDLSECFIQNTKLDYQSYLKDEDQLKEIHLYAGKELIQKISLLPSLNEQYLAQVVLDYKKSFRKSVINEVIILNELGKIIYPNNYTIEKKKKAEQKLKSRSYVQNLLNSPNKLDISSYGEVTIGALTGKASLPVAFKYTQKNQSGVVILSLNLIALSENLRKNSSSLVGINDASSKQGIAYHSFLGSPVASFVRNILLAKSDSLVINFIQKEKQGLVFEYNISPFRNLFLKKATRNCLIILIFASFAWIAIWAREQHIRRQAQLIHEYKNSSIFNQTRAQQTSKLIQMLINDNKNNNNNMLEQIEDVYDQKLDVAHLAQSLYDFLKSNKATDSLYEASFYIMFYQTPKKFSISKIFQEISKIKIEPVEIIGYRDLFEMFVQEIFLLCPIEDLTCVSTAPNKITVSFKTKNGFHRYERINYLRLYLLAALNNIKISIKDKTELLVIQIDYASTMTQNDIITPNNL